MEYFNQILDKLGIYDLFAVLLSGIIAVSTTLVVAPIFFNADLSTYIQPDQTIIFLVLCYLVGIFLQEAGNLLYRLFLKRGKKILSKLLNPSSDTDIKSDNLSINEILRIKNAAKEHIAESELDDTILLYNYCRYRSPKNTSADKDQALAAMSRSLSIYFGTLGLSILVPVFVRDDINKLGFIVCIFVALLLAIMLWSRCERFYKIRYARIFRTFYYSQLNNNP